MEETLFVLKEQISQLKLQLSTMEETVAELSKAEELKEKLNDMMFQSSSEDLSNRIESQNNAVDITDTQEAIGEVLEISDTNSSDITDIQEAVSELMEMIMEG